MAVFNTNQATQFYVVTNSSADGTLLGDPKTNTTPGTIDVVKGNDNKTGWFSYRNAIGELVSTDKFEISNVIYATAAKASKLRRTTKAIAIELDKNVNDGNPISGQDYILRINFTGYYGLGNENTYVKQGMVHAYAGMSASTFYRTLALSLAKNFSREASKPLAFYLGTTGGTSREITSKTTMKDLETVDDAIAVIIKEVEQPWVLGTMPSEPVNFEIGFTPITVQGDERVWGSVAAPTALFDVTGDTVGNGKKVADMEYFYMGERGDQYRNMGWPNVIPTKYMVDPTKEYDIITIHYCYSGSNEAVQKSEKDMIFVGDGLLGLSTKIKGVLGIDITGLENE